MAPTIFLLFTGDIGIPQSQPTQGVRKLGFYPPVSIHLWLCAVPKGINSPAFQPAPCPVSFCKKALRQSCRNLPSASSRALSVGDMNRTPTAPNTLPYSYQIVTCVLSLCRTSPLQTQSTISPTCPSQKTCSLPAPPTSELSSLNIDQLAIVLFTVLIEIAHH